MRSTPSKNPSFLTIKREESNLPRRKPTFGEITHWIILKISDSPRIRKGLLIRNTWRVFNDNHDSAKIYIPEQQRPPTQTPEKLISWDYLALFYLTNYCATKNSVLPLRSTALHFFLSRYLFYPTLNYSIIPQVRYNWLRPNRCVVTPKSGTSRNKLF